MSFEKLISLFTRRHINDSLDFYGIKIGPAKISQFVESKSISNVVFYHFRAALILTSINICVVYMFFFCEIDFVGNFFFWKTRIYCQKHFSEKYLYGNLN